MQVPYLLDHVEMLDDETLPLDFYKRLAVAMRDASLSAKKAMACDRDDQIRSVWPAVYSEIVQQWRVDRGAHPYKYGGAIEAIADRMHHSRSEVKRAVEEKDAPDLRKTPGDFSRLTEKRLQVQKRQRK